MAGENRFNVNLKNVSIKQIFTVFALIIGLAGSGYGGFHQFNKSMVENNIEVSGSAMEAMNMELEKINTTQNTILRNIDNLTTEMNNYRDLKTEHSTQIASLAAKVEALDGSLDFFKEFYLSEDH